MPRYVSKGGKWSPQKEYYVNPKARRGEDPIYEGPDRAATEVLTKEGVEFLGTDYRTNPDLLRQARELGYKDTDTFLKEMYNVDPKEQAKIQEKKLEEVYETSVGDKPERKAPIRTASGGDDTSGKGHHIKGGFDEPPGISGPDTNKRV